MANEKTFLGEVFGTCDRYTEEDDGTCSDVFEIFISAKTRKELDKLRDGVKCSVVIKERKGGRKP